MRGRIEFVVLIRISLGLLHSEPGNTDWEINWMGSHWSCTFWWIPCRTSAALEAQTRILASERAEKFLVCSCISIRSPHMLPIYSNLSWFYKFNGNPGTLIQPPNLALEGSTIFTNSYHLFSETMVSCVRMVPMAMTLLAFKADAQKNRALSASKGMRIGMEDSWDALAISLAISQMSLFLSGQSQMTADRCLFGSACVPVRHLWRRASMFHFDWSMVSVFGSWQVVEALYGLWLQLDEERPTFFKESGGFWADNC